ncbi:hypothetical protein J6590_103363, partial [Homalodisca vitripennis]
LHQTKKRVHYGARLQLFPRSYIDYFLKFGPLVENVESLKARVSSLYPLSTANTASVNIDTARPRWQYEPDLLCR